jgi:hypothetical protein
MNPERQTVTLAVVIEHGALADRHRATAQDGCEIEKYERIEIKFAQ